jgi:isopenicillin N synthase-like dioxygenase
VPVPEVPDAQLPIVDVSGPPASFAADVDRACRDRGFFYVVGHGIDPTLTERLAALAAEFFALPDDEKAAIAMTRGGRAWRGWFGVGDELTSGRPDRKEGLYLGSELAADPRPLHGPNLWPERPAGLREAVLEYLDAATAVGQHVLDGMAVGLGLGEGWFRRGLTADPLVLFRLFHYPPAPPQPRAGWGVGEHTDYGLLTLLWQDDAGGLEVRGPGGWTAAPPVPGSLVCNLGDMLDRMTGGRYRSTPHRAQNASDRDRITFPLFLDPGWDTVVAPMDLPGPAPDDDAATRWDGTSLRELSGTYGEYLLGKVSRVFPDLFAEVV